MTSQTAACSSASIPDGLNSISVPILPMLPMLQYDSGCTTPSVKSSDNDSIKSDPIYRKAKKNKRKHKHCEESIGVLYEDTSNGEMLPRIVISRIMKTDIRRSYTDMFANVYNACNFDLLSSYLMKFYRPDYALVQELFGAFPSKLKGKYEMHGKSVILKYWYERMHDWPDVAIRIIEKEIKIESDYSGVISVRFTMSGTQMLPASEPIINPTCVKYDANNNPIMVFGEEKLSDAVQKQIASVVSPNFDTEDIRALHFDFDSFNDTSDTWRDCVRYEPLPKQLNQLTPIEQGSNSVLLAESPPTGENWVQLQPEAQPNLTSIFCVFEGLMLLHFDADSLIFFCEFYLFGG